MPDPTPDPPKDGPRGPTLKKNNLVWLLGTADNVNVHFGLYVGYDKWRWAMLPRAEADTFFEFVNDLFNTSDHWEMQYAKLVRSIVDFQLVVGVITKPKTHRFGPKDSLPCPTQTNVPTSSPSPASPPSSPKSPPSTAEPSSDSPKVVTSS